MVEKKARPLKYGLIKTIQMIKYLFLFLFVSCTQKDYSYLNEDRRTQVIRVSQHYTNPVKILNGKWIPDTIVYYYYSKDTYAGSYMNLPPDTLPKIWTNCLTFEIAYYIIKN